jgi:hypothetical protein
LAGLAWDAARLDGAQNQQVTISVRDADGQVMEVKFSLEISRQP